MANLIRGKNQDTKTDQSSNDLSQLGTKQATLAAFTKTQSTVKYTSPETRAARKLERRSAHHPDKAQAIQHRYDRLAT